MRSNRVHAAIFIGCNPFELSQYHSYFKISAMGPRPTIGSTNLYAYYRGLGLTYFKHFHSFELADTVTIDYVQLCY